MKHSPISLQQKSGSILSVWRAAVALAAAGAATLASHACGPDFPNVYLTEGSKSLLAAPEGYFAAEINRLVSEIQKKGSGKASIKDVDDPSDADDHGCDCEGGVDLLTREIDELKESLKSSGVSADDSRGIIAAYKAARAAIEEKRWSDFELPKNMPAEFALYLRGAHAYRQSEYDEAKIHWKALLDLPEDQRHYRSVWAAYMLGRMDIPGWGEIHTYGRAYITESLVRDRLVEGAQWMAMTNWLFLKGFADTAGLAQQSIGWEARARLLLGDHVSAIHNYLTLFGTGDVRVAVDSLRVVGSSVLALDKEEMITVARDEWSRRVVTLYLLARFGSSEWYDENVEARITSQSRTWASTLESMKLRDLPDTDTLAWIAYQAGYFGMARQWVDLAPKDSVSGNWIRAKLAMRDGDAKAAEALLTKVTASSDLVGPARPEAWADLGRVRMGLRDYTGALDAFIAGGHWTDAAYIAERVLNLGELQNYADASCPSYAGENVCQWGETEAEIREMARHLLARRLARAKYHEEALRYFPKGLAEKYTGYLEDVKLGFETDRSAKKRAEALWRAAVCIRENGMELLGTELAPDFYIWGGSFETMSIAQEREDDLRLEGGLVAPSLDELERIHSHTVPTERFHYRYRAAELAWWAASLMPNDDAETANMLATAGGWLKNRDPKAANQFFQALVIRCGGTELGKAAAAKRWFP